jgi:hypothetical protein
MTAGGTVFLAFRKYDSHFEDEARKYACIIIMLQGLVSRKDGYFTDSFPGYVSIGLLQMCLGYIWLDALLDMTAGVAVFLAFRKYDSHFEDEAQQVCLRHEYVSKGLVSRKDGHFIASFPGYVSIGLL